MMRLSIIDAVPKAPDNADDTILSMSIIGESGDCGGRGGEGGEGGGGGVGACAIHMPASSATKFSVCIFTTRVSLLLVARSSTSMPSWAAEEASGVSISSDANMAHIVEQSAELFMNFPIE